MSGNEFAKGGEFSREKQAGLSEKKNLLQCLARPGKIQYLLMILL